MDTKPLPAEKDPLYAAVGLPWPREVFLVMTAKERVVEHLSRTAQYATLGIVLELFADIEHAAFCGERTPPQHSIDRLLFFLREANTVRAA